MKTNPREKLEVSECHPTCVARKSFKFVTIAAFWNTSGGSTFSSLLSSVKMSLPLTSSKLSTCTEEVSDSDLLMTSPRIGKSFCSRIKASPPQLTTGGHGGIDEVDAAAGGVNGGSGGADTSYVPADPVDGLPTLSPPPYKANSTSGGSTSSVCGTGSAGGKQIMGS